MLPLVHPDRQPRHSSYFRRRRLLLSSLLFFASFLFILYLRVQPSWSVSLNNRVLPWGRARPTGSMIGSTVDELKALLYMLTTSDADLPDDFIANAEHLDLRVLAGGSDLSVADWNQRIDVMDKFNPLIVFSKTYCQYSRKAKQLLETYDIHPSPRIIEVDLRHDSELIKALLTRFTFHSTFPNILIHGKTLGGSDDLHLLHESGKLRKVLEDAGLSVGAEGDINVGVVNELAQDEHLTQRKGISRRSS